VTCDQVECFVFRKLSSVLLPQLERDQERDVIIWRRIESLWWFSSVHLDVAWGGDEADQFDWSPATTKLVELTKVRAPADKIACLLSCFRQVSECLSQLVEQLGGRSPSKASLSADDILPAVILVLVKANPPKLFSHVNYALAYQRPTRLDPEAQYFVVTLTSAAQYLLDMNHAQLGMKKEDFQHLLLQPRPPPRK
jgi:hypothetical protein